MASEGVQSPEAWEALRAFARLIEDSIADLEAATLPAQLASALDARLPAWEQTDADFASFLRELKGQVWSMEAAQLRAVRERVIAHLRSNLAEVQGRLGRR